MKQGSRSLHSVFCLASECQGWSMFNNSCFKFYTGASKTRSWAAAMNQCKKDGGNLASIASSEENKELQDLITQKSISDIIRLIWIGFHDMATENNFEWSDQSNVTYANWASNEPNDRLGQDCVAMRASDGKWIDVDCTTTFISREYFCEKRKPNIMHNLQIHTYKRAHTHTT